MDADFGRDYPIQETFSAEGPVKWPKPTVNVRRYCEDWFFFRRPAVMIVRCKLQTASGAGDPPAGILSWTVEIRAAEKQIFDEAKAHWFGSVQKYVLDEIRRRTRSGRSESWEDGVILDRAGPCPKPVLQVYFTLEVSSS